MGNRSRIIPWTPVTVNASYHIGRAPVGSTWGTSREQGLLFRVGHLSQVVYSVHSNHMAAVSRATYAFLLVLLVWTSAAATAPTAAFNDAFAIAFAGFAILALVVSISNWYVDFRLSEAFIALDVLAFAVLTVSRTGGGAGAVLSALCLLAHILFVSVLRWRNGLVFAIAAFLNTFWIADIAIFELSHGSMTPLSALRWSLFAILESAVVIWASAQVLKTDLPRFAAEAPDPELPLTASAIGYAMKTAGAAEAILCWIDPRDRGCYTCSQRAMADKKAPAKLSFSAADAFRKLELMLFDARRGHAIVLRDGKFIACAGYAVPGRALLAELGVSTGICIPIDGEEGRSWLVLAGICMLGWGHLYLAEAVCSEIRQGMSWQTASVNALNAALARLRRTVACDLHDSVAHSLVGARFLLVALRSKLDANSEVVQEIDTIKDALEAEQIHVRRLIDQLRETDADARVRNLVDDLRSAGQALEMRWQIDVELVDSDFRIQVPVWFSLEVQQIVREAISNGVRHGGASRATIKCGKRSGAIEIEVMDNGAGFADPQMPALPRSISERLGGLGGSLEIASKRGETMLRMSLPSSIAD
ncbi:sensor histidine kinase [Novosphingobium sp.]|uniref:sensor histidine kinase n=1 Tax=Novosphingobium sp. TaxID=1874826 RepID=UPI002B47BE9E|nr:histidine kinase [Novosphingobium sp.]HKR91202.1 histidine kinase [Novosphingobium sp.]